jgi:GTP cyclohydrolase I
VATNERHLSKTPQPYRVPTDNLAATFDRHSGTTSWQAVAETFGHDPGREGLARTPDRVARLYQEYLAPRPLCEITTFDAEGTHEMIVLRDRLSGPRPS